MRETPDVIRDLNEAAQAHADDRSGNVVAIAILALVWLAGFLMGHWLW